MTNCTAIKNWVIRVSAFNYLTFFLCFFCSQAIQSVSLVSPEKFQYNKRSQDGEVQGSLWAVLDPSVTVLLV